MKRLKTKTSHALYTMLLLVFFTSCSNDTTMFWNWKDVIGLSILGILILAFGIIMLIEWIKIKWRKFRKEQNLEDENKALHIGGIMPRFLFRYKYLDENFKVEIEAENLNKAMFIFATYYHQIQEIYSVVRVA